MESFVKGSFVNGQVGAISGKLVRCDPNCALNASNLGLFSILLLEQEEMPFQGVV